MHILLTRPQEESLSTAQALGQSGHSVSIVPVLEIQPLDEEIRLRRLKDILGRGRPDGIICVSKNAVHWGLPQLLESWPAATEEAKWYALGSGTRDALIIFGVNPETPTVAQSENFLKMPELQTVAGQRFFYVAGENGRPFIENELAARGAEILRWDVYRRRSDQAASAQLVLLEEIPDLLTAMSGDSLLAFEQALPDANRGEWLSRKLLVPSERVSDLARKMGFADIEVVRVTEKDWPLGYVRSL